MENPRRGSTFDILEHLRDFRCLSFVIFLAVCVTARAEISTNLPLPLKVVGTNIVNEKGEPVLLRGVNAACLEWTSDGEGRILKTVDTAIKEWHANIIRLPLSQDRWFGKGP